MTCSIHVKVSLGGIRPSLRRRVGFKGTSLGMVPGTFTPGKVLPPLLVANQDSQVKAQIRYEGKRPPGIMCQRSENRENKLFKKAFQLSLLLGLQFLVVSNVNSLLLQ